MAKTYSKCRWWRGGHQWSKWCLAQYDQHWGTSKIQTSYTITLNERRCGKCGKVETGSLR